MELASVRAHNKRAQETSKSNLNKKNKQQKRINFERIESGGKSENKT